MATERDRANSVQVLAKAAQLLDCLAEERELTAAALAEKIGEPRSTVYRLLSSLQALDMIEAGGRRGTYRLGLKLLRLGSSVIARFDERQAALPVMERLHEQTEETVYLSIRRGYEAVCIERIDGRWVQSVPLRIGGSLPLHIGAGPRVLLAYEPHEFREEYVHLEKLATFTRNTLTEPAALLEELENVRRAGCSISDEDVVLGIAAVGAPIFGHQRAIRAALSMSGPMPSILGENERESRELITAAAAEISRALGFDATALLPVGA